MGRGARYHRATYAAFIIWAACASACAQTPASELAAALSHCETLPPSVQPGAFYLTLYSIAEADRQEAARVVSYAINAISRSRVITPPQWISDTLGVVYLPYYAPTAKDYSEFYNAKEKLGDGDATFHIRTQVSTDVHRLGKSIRTVTTDGGWIGLQAAQRLKHLTRSNVPILRADYFVAAALSSPAYYQLVGVPNTETEFLQSIGVDSKAIEKLRANAGANLIISNVTQKPRRIEWLQGPLGGLYITRDVERVDAARDPVRRPISSGGLNFVFDASELFAMSPNALWRVALYDAKGNIQQSVPDKVAKDTSDPHGDGIVTPLVSCIRCHAEGGLRPFTDDQTKLLSKSVIESYDPAIVQRALEFYQEDRLQRQMDFDRKSYEEAVWKCTAEKNEKGELVNGMKPAELAAALAKVVRNFSYLPVSLDQAALECGVDVDEFRAAVVRTHDPILLTLLDGRPVLRGQFESSFAEAALACAARRK